MQAFKLRPYQKSAVSSVLARYRAGERRMLLYLPTGAGKTVIATFIIQALREQVRLGRCLFVAHRREILDQTAQTPRRHLPGLDVQVEQGERTSDTSADMTTTAVSTTRRSKRSAAAPTNAPKRPIGNIRSIVSIATTKAEAVSW